MVSACLSDFKILFTRISDLSHMSLLNCFLSNFHGDFQWELYLLKSKSLRDTMEMAKLVEDKCSTFHNHISNLNTFFRQTVVFQHYIPFLLNGWLRMRWFSNASEPLF